MYFWGGFDFTSATVSTEKCFQLSYPCRYPVLPFGTGTTVERVAAGQKFMTVLSSDGALYGLGSNHAGQMGASVGEYTNTLRLLKVETRFPVTDIACGSKHTLLRCSDGSVFSAGDNAFGQLGRKSKAKDFAQVQLPANIVSIAAGNDTCFAINAQGQVFSWGNAEYGSLGHGDKGERMDPITLRLVTENIEIPKVIEWFVKKKIAILGVSAGKSHVLFRSQTDVYACGDASFGKLGNGDVEAVTAPLRVEFPQRKEPEVIEDIAAGESHSVVLKRNVEQNSVVYFFGKPGSNADGYLTPVLVPDLPSNVRRIVAGRQVTLAVTHEGKVYVWGHHPSLPGMGLTIEATRSIPSPISSLLDFHATHAATGATFFVCFADDTRAKRACLDVVVPFADRGDAENAQHYEACALSFYQKLLGQGAGTSYFDNIPKAPPKPAPVKPDYTKRGAKSLKPGSKVRLWMSDVYALATIGEVPAATKGPSASQAAPRTKQKALQQAQETPTQTEGVGRGVLIEWLRDDWYPEMIELDSDDETLDEENENRWHHGWFLQPPVSAGM